MNPRVLQWARDRIGLSLVDAASSVGRPVEVLAAWEEGSQAPTFRQLEALARVYRRPVAVFFFPEPPREPELRSEFRTLPEPDFEGLDPDTRIALREGLAWQQSLRELTGGRNPSDRQIIRDIAADPRQPVDELVARVREYLGISLEAQAGCPNATAAFKEWRDAVERAGIFVFKRSFEQSSVSGFCLHDPEFPVIVINNSTAHTRQTFTLFHELGHLLFHVSGITIEGSPHWADLGDTDREIEVACNRFAAEFLVPEASFPWTLFEGRDPAEAVPEVADRYNVSREVVLRRLLDMGLVNTATYRRLADEWNQEYLERRGASGGGGNYYATQATYLGDNYLRLAFGQFHAGRISMGDLADHLGIKARNVRKLEDFLLSRRR